ncbi:MAG: type I restriction enzyme HsdR N-terminal domain-containing protein [Candidatus Acidiferrum sp.]
MHIDTDGLVLQTESDVEQKVVYPLLTGTQYLAIPEGSIYTKQYLSPTQLDKASGKQLGYYPDYTIWICGFPAMVVEAKAPDVAVEEGYRDASLYARHLNQVYRTNLNPCRFILSCNGQTLLCGYWDCEPILRLQVKDLKQNSSALSQVGASFNYTVVEAHANECLAQVRSHDVRYAYNLAGGQALLHARCPVNSFAAELSPVLRRYFSSETPEQNREIIERAYVSSSEVTEYDRILEALLKERQSIWGSSIVEELEPGKHRETKVASAIAEFDRVRPASGQLQIIQGSVGSGKSLFIRRYKELLQPEVAAQRTMWSFIDFNKGPANLRDAENWLCQAFVDGFEAENPSIDMAEGDVLRGIFSHNLQRRKSIYDDLGRSSPQEAALARARDLAAWQDSPQEYARGLSEYILGGRREVLVVVMDNVDRLDLESQLNAFQLTLWFLQMSHAFVILQMRDETYERFKNKPPLDAYRTGITFHITPPRFVDVVKRRLELSLEYLQANVPPTQSYRIESGAKVTYPKARLEQFLSGLYHDLFDRQRNISRVLEALAGRDVRHALEMFVSIITSGHLSETAITSTVLGAGATPITEQNVLKILMRTDYEYFSESSGFISNIFDFDPDWQKPDNFLLVEALFYLAINRRRKGQIGLEGYFSGKHVADELQRMGYVPADVLAGLNLLLKRRLVTADHMNFTSLTFQDSVRISASGFIHLRVLARQFEYLFGVIPTTPLMEADVARNAAEAMKFERIKKHVPSYKRMQIVESFYLYLARQKHATSTPFSQSMRSGSAYVLHHISAGIQNFKNVNTGRVTESDALDF